MQDEQFMRHWSNDHNRFSADLDRGLGYLMRHFRQRLESREPIGRSYGLLAKYETPVAAPPALSPTAQASLRGLAASVLTVVLWVSVMLVATPAPGLA